jgi:hypothetical protein
MLLQWFASTAQFYRRHYSPFRYVQLVLLVKWIVLARLVRDIIRLPLTHERCTRNRIKENVAVWLRVLLKQP